MRIGIGIAAALVAALGFAGVAAGQAASHVAVTTDKTTYIDSFYGDRVVRITASGLAACAGDDVEVALFDAGPDGNEPPERFDGRSLTVAVSAAGTVEVEIPVLWERSGTIAYAGVRAACVPGGIALSEPLTFTHGDPPFGPVLPAEPLPHGYALTAALATVPPPPPGSGLVWAVSLAVAGFEECAGRRIAVNLAYEDGSPVPEDIWQTRFVDIDGSRSQTTLFTWTGARPGRYLTWIRSVCTGTWVAPQVIEVLEERPSAPQPRGLPPTPPATLDFSVSVRVTPGPMPTDSTGSPPDYLNVTLAGFESCAASEVWVSLAHPDGRQVIVDNIFFARWPMTVSGNTEETWGFYVEVVPPGEYRAWISSDCTGSWTAPETVIIPDTPGPVGFDFSAPGPPGTGTGTGTASEGDRSAILVAAFALLIAGGGVIAVARCL